MRKQLAGIAGVGTVLVALAAGPSAAQGGLGLASYAASSAAQALRLQIAGTTLVAGDATAKLDSTTLAEATGIGAVLDPALVGSTAAKSPADGANVVVPETCSPLVIADESLPLANATACGQSAAETDGDPSSSGSGFVDELTIEIEGTPLDEPLTTILGDEGAGQLLNALEPVTGPLAESGLDVNSLLVDVIDALVDGTPAASVTLGPARSATEVTADAITATASAEGGVISLLGLVDVLVGPSSASVSVNRSTGAITHSEQAAAISVTLHEGLLGVIPDELEGPLFDGLGAPLEGTVRTIELLTAEQLAALQDSGLFDANGCLNPGEALPAPLNTLVCVQVAATSYTEDAEGPEISAASTATAANIRLLDGIVPDGGVQLAVSESAATVAAVLNQPTTTTEAPGTTTARLARTGGGTAAGPWFAVVLAAGLGAFVLARRSASLR